MKLSYRQSKMKLSYKQSRPIKAKEYIYFQFSIFYKPKFEFIENNHLYYFMFLLCLWFLFPWRMSLGKSGDNFLTSAD